jgi:hypothetical protein
MATLISMEQFATWTRQDVGIVAADPFATLVLQTATEIVCDTAEQPNWELQSPPVVVPRKASRICMFLAGRTYLNPDGTVSEAVGPLNERRPEAMAMAAANMQLLPGEIDDLLTLVPDGPAGLWVQPTTRTDAVEDDAVYLPDDSGSDWWIPYGDSSTTLAFTPVESA